MQSCSTCTDYLPSTAHPNIIAADAFRRALPPYPEGRYTGRGVVIAGGGRYWASVYVAVRMLRHVGCTLPVQVWFLGEKERDDQYTALLAPFGVEVVDALAHPEAAKARGLTGFTGHAPFELKSFAVLHSSFENVLCLDADCYPCADPTTLFDAPAHRRSGGTFFPDLPGTNAWTKWKDWGVVKFGPDCGWEVGQYLVDKRVAWGPVNLARWYDDHGDWCYGYNRHHDHGDKGPWRVSWAAHRVEPAFYTTTARWDKLAFVHPGPDGVTPVFVHRCRSKFAVGEMRFLSTVQNGTNLRGGLPLESAAFGYLAELAAGVIRG